MKLWVTREDHSSEVEFSTSGERLFLEIDGRRLEADFLRLPDGEVYSLLVDGRSYEVRVSAPGAAAAAETGAPGVEVTLKGAVLPVEVRHPLERLLQAQRQGGAVAGGETVAAPMPGLLVEYRVKVGDVVAPHQPVAVVEAMKMQNELTARRGGVVSDLLVAERTSVSAGQALVKLKAAT